MLLKTQHPNCLRPTPAFHFHRQQISSSKLALQLTAVPPLLATSPSATSTQPECGSETTAELEKHEVRAETTVSTN